MTGVYVYAQDCGDFTTTGLVGDLQPMEATFEEEKNGISQMHVTLAYDSLGKWKAVQPGTFLKAPVPVRVPPNIVDGDYARTVTRYETVTDKVPMYAEPEKKRVIGYDIGKSSGIVSVGKVDPAKLMVLGSGLKHSADEKQKKRVTGYVERSSLRAIEEIEIAPAAYGMESIEDLVTRISDQIFRVVTVIQEDDRIEIEAEHIFYELKANYTKYKPAAEYEVTGSTAVNQILGEAYDPDHGFSISSSSTKTQKGLDWERKSIVEALLDPDKGACALYGMVLLRDNREIYCLPEEDVGFDRGYVIEYGKNLVSIQRTEDISDVITRVYPYGKDEQGNAMGIRSGVEYVESDRAGDYGQALCGLLDTKLQIGKDEITEDNFDAKLREAAEKIFTEDHQDEPKMELVVDFLSLGDTEEYSQYRGLDKVYLYDKVTVKDGLRGFTYTAEVVAVKHNVLTGMLEEVTLGSINNSDGVRKIATWQVPEVNGENIRLKTILAGSFAPGAIQGADISEGAIDTVHIRDAAIDTAQIKDAAIDQAKIKEAAIGTAQIEDAAITQAKIGEAAIGKAQMQEAAIGDAQIESAGINWAKIKELNAESAYFGQAVFQQAVGEKLYIPRLLFDTAQGRQMIVNDLIIGADDGNYYSLNIVQNEDGSYATNPVMVPITDEEAAAGHTSDGKAIIGTTATYQELTAQEIYGIDALISKITAARIDVDQLWARRAFIDALRVQDLSSNTYIRAVVGNWTSEKPISDAIAGINKTIGELGRGQIYYSVTEPEDPAIGDLWVQTQTGVAKWVDADKLTWDEFDQYKWHQLGIPPKMRIYTGEGWDEVNDSSIFEAHETQINQLADSIGLKASTYDLDTLGNRVTAAQASIEINSRSIAQEVTNRQTAVSGAMGSAQEYARQVAEAAETAARAGSIAKTTNLQTAEGIVTAAVAQAATEAGQNYIAKTSRLQTADQIVEEAKSYTNGQLGSYSTRTQTADAIGAEVTKIRNGTTAAGKVITTTAKMDADGIYLATGGTFTVASGNFSVDANGNVSMKGTVTATGGTIGGWNIGANALTGAKTGMAKTTADTDIAFWAGNASAASAPFRVSQSGEVYLTKLYTVGEDGKANVVNLGNYSLWKLNYATVKSISVGNAGVTITTTAGTYSFNSAASVTTSAVELYGDPGEAATSLSITVALSNGRRSIESIPVTTYRNRVYNKGKADGEAAFTLHDSAVYNITNDTYRNVTHFIQQGSGFASIGSGFVRVAQAASKWYSKEE